MKLVSRCVLFLADFLPLFIILDILYVGTTLWNSITTIAVTVISVISYLYWRYILNKDRDIYDGTVSEVTDIGNQYVNYIISYLGLLFPLLLMHDLRGFLIFVALMVVVFLIYINTSLLFYNPILTIFSYRFYNVKFKDMGQVYVLTKREVKVDEQLSVKQLVQGVFVAD
ncbi:MAG: hypothetical protein ACYCPR_04810 [Thermoplasmataceae archaeon]